MRKSGILMPIFSLASRFGIGCFSREAYEFIDFLYESGQSYWQILPLGPTGYGNSPYQPFSAFAGNPYFISLEDLINEGLLTWDECNVAYFGSNEEIVDYGAMYENRMDLLFKAYIRFAERDGDKSEDYKKFLKDTAYWLEDYCLFRAIKQKENGASWQTWDDKLRSRDAQAIKDALKEHEEIINFYKFLQYKFALQWKALRKYAEDKNIKIIGDIPFYVSLDSADVWAHPEVFQMDKNLEPKVVAGCAPDAFSTTGQLWGNPIYDWDALKKSDYEWWVKRIERSFELTDVIRIDHFHGFAQYYAVPYGDETAENGKAHKGPGMDFFDVLKMKIGNFADEDGARIIAEDLGEVTKENQKLLADTGIPGMKILQYAFTSWDSIYMPYKHDKNCVVYTGTHDNIPTRAWIDCINQGEREYLKKYMNSSNADGGALTWDLIRECFRSVGDLCIIPLQDYLCKGMEARINTPGGAEGNWEWRLKPNFLSHELAGAIRGLTETYGRI